MTPTGPDFDHQFPSDLPSGSRLSQQQSNPKSESEPMKTLHVNGEGPSITVEHITPQLAEKYLASNTNNRNISERVVTAMSEAMLANRWETTNQGIAFSGDGTLVDGQHRLMAVVKSGKAQHFVVARGIKDVRHIDTGRSRSIPDALKLIDGMVNSRRSVAYVCMLLAIELNRAISPSAMGYEIVKSALAKWKTELEWFYAQERGGPTSRLLSAPVVAAFLLVRREDPQLAEDFLRGYVSGENLTSGSPELMLRNYTATHGAMGLDNRLALARKTLTALWHKKHGSKISRLAEQGGIAEEFNPVGLARLIPKAIQSAK